MVVPNDLIRSIECLSQNLFISPPTLSQFAATAAFDSESECQANVVRYAVNRGVLLDRLPKYGFGKLASADGAFYIYANIDELAQNSSVFCRKMLSDSGVAATPGIDFDPTRGKHYVRFSFAGATEDIIEACDRLETWLC